MQCLFAIDTETTEFVSTLIKRGADLIIADLEGRTALHYLAMFSPKQRAEQLIPRRHHGFGGGAGILGGSAEEE
jgi:ankyrin repeat protein